MTLRRMHHVGVVVEDLPAATAFFLELGFELESKAAVEGEWVDRVVGLDGIQVDTAMVQTPDGNGRLELIRFIAPPGPAADPEAPANTPGLRHLAFIVDDLDAVLARLEGHGGKLIRAVERYEDVYRLCYIRGPEGIIVELAEELGSAP